MERDELKKIIEVLLFVSDKPLSLTTMREVVKDADERCVREIVEELNNDYTATGRSFSIREIAGGFQMLTDPIHSKWIAILYKKQPDKLTVPTLETLAIIAYKQPITRGEIEAIRGVNVERIIHNLEDRKLIKMKGRLDVPGRPLLYGTTSDFLQHFGLKSLEELPKLKEFQEADLDFVKEQQNAPVIDTDTGALRDARLRAHATIASAEHPADEDAMMSGGETAGSFDGRDGEAVGDAADGGNTEETRDEGEETGA